MTPSDAELIGKAMTQDDRAAFGQLVLRHQSAVRQFLRHLTHGNAALADDLAQETLVHAYRQLASFRGDARFSTWLLGIAHNHWRNARRRNRDDVAMSDQLPTEDDATRAADLRHDLAAALATLSAQEQLAIHLGYQQGLSHAEIAELVDWPLGTVKTHLARAKDKLRPLLAAWTP